MNLNKNDFQSKGIYDAEGSAPSLYSGESRFGGGECYVLTQVVIENHGQDVRFKECGDICQSVTASWGEGRNNASLVVETFKKTAHPRNKNEGQGWERTEVNDTLNIFDNGEVRTPTLIVTEALDF